MITEMNALCACQELAVEGCVYCGEPMCSECFEQGNGFCNPNCDAAEREAVKDDVAFNDRQEVKAKWCKVL